MANSRRCVSCLGQDPHTSRVPSLATDMVGHETDYYERWEATLLAPYLDEGAKDVASSYEPSRSRPITFFFGGKTDSRGGHHGYHVREMFRKQARATAKQLAPAASLVFVDASASDASLGQCGADLGRRPTACRGSFVEGPLLRKAEFALAVRGDRPGTNRLERCMEFGAIPLFVSDRVFHVSMPFQCLIPYAHFAAIVGEEPFVCEPSVVLRAALAEWPPSRRRRARQLMQHFARDVLWRAPGSRVAENILLEAAMSIDKRRHTDVASRALAGAPALACAFRNQLLYRLQEYNVTAWARQRWYDPAMSCAEWKKRALPPATRRKAAGEGRWPVHQAGRHRRHRSALKRA